jgi:hypothetical protein
VPGIVHPHRQDRIACDARHIQTHCASLPTLEDLGDARVA